MRSARAVTNSDSVVGRVVDFVDEDVFFIGEIDGRFEAHQQLCEGFMVSTHQHGQRLMSIGGDSSTLAMIRSTLSIRTESLVLA